MIETTAEARPQWGHALLTPAGDPKNPVHEIRVPKWAFPELRRLGLLDGGRAQLTPSVWLFVRPTFDSLALSLRLLLGGDISGPAWCRCKCRECQGRDADGDNTMLPGQQVPGIDTDEIVSDVKSRRPRRGDGRKD